MKTNEEIAQEIYQGWHYDGAMVHRIVEALSEKDKECDEWEDIAKQKDIKIIALKKELSSLSGLRTVLEGSRTAMKAMKIWVEETARLNRDNKPLTLVAQAEARICDINVALSPSPAVLDESCDKGDSAKIMEEYKKIKGSLKESGSPAEEQKS